MVLALGKSADPGGRQLEDRQRHRGKRGWRENERHQRYCRGGSSGADGWDLKQKSAGQLEDVRAQVANVGHHVVMLKLSLTDQIKVDNKELAEDNFAIHGA